jgi:hypothetical protein
MDILKKELKSKIDKHKLNFDIEKIDNIFPFNTFERVVVELIVAGALDYEEYQKLREEYVDRNKNLNLYEITAPRAFGETWAQNHIIEIDGKKILRPNKIYDLNYSGEYDLWMPHNNKGIKIEVKASRAVDANSNLPLTQKALSTLSDKQFNINFQQIKLKSFDVIIWIGVWTDKIKYWTLNSSEIINNKYFSKGQHRGNIGEGQLWVTKDNIEEFSKYLVHPKNLVKTILKKYNTE